MKEKAVTAVQYLLLLGVLIIIAFVSGWAGGRWAVWSSHNLLDPVADYAKSTSALPAQEGSLPSSVAFLREQTETAGGRTAYLGIRGKEFHQLDVRGVKIIEVFPDSPAAKGGVRSDRDPLPAQVSGWSGEAGHIIRGVDGRVVRSEEDLSRFLLFSTPGQVVQLLVSSADGYSYEVLSVKLGAAPETANSSTSKVPAEENWQVSSGQQALAITARTSRR
jgi:hypothetical protein